MARVLVILILCWCASAQDARLAGLKATLAAMRGHAQDYPKTRGAGPQLTVAKHQLRDWVESRLGKLGERDDPGELVRQLNHELRAIKLLCDGDCYLEEIGLRSDPTGSLLLRTGAGIECGFDDSAYLYKWTVSGWRRFWESEQNSYTERDYKPQRIHDVLISPQWEANTNQLILTLGTQTWCASNWHSVYYRIWRRDAGNVEPKLLLDGSEFAYLGRNSPPIQGSAGPDDVLIEFAIASVDAAVHNREAVRHYRVKDRVQPVDPIALSPRDFVDEWLTQPWNEAASWTAGSIEGWHQELHSEHVSGDFHPTMHCKTPDLWQVGISLKNTDTYFLVRWRPPYQFRMVDVRKTPWPNCTEKDPAADEPRTLFPTQNWR